VGPGSITSFKEYRALFEGAENQRVIGEASPRYLCDPDVLTGIDRVLPGAKAIAVLRDPVERAWSSYSKALILGEED
jgi:hypothetical protein